MVASAIALVAATVVAQDTPAPGIPQSPFTSYIGRFIDSASTTDYQAPNRTLRADRVKIDLSRDRIYMKAGGGYFFGYQLSNFASQLSGPFAIGAHGEQYRTPLFKVNPETNPSWSITMLDGQERLFDFDFDDRGYIYLAYSVWGFGIVDSQGHFVRQVTAGQLGFSAAAILAFASENHHYVAVSSFQSSATLWDVTDPTSPQFVRSLGFVVSGYAKNAAADQIAIVVPNSASVKIFTPAQLVSGGTPVEVQSHGSGYTFDQVATNGTNFYASEHSSANTIISTIAPSGGAFNKTETITTPKTAFPPLSLSYGFGYLVLTSHDSTGSTLALLYKWNGNAFEEYDPRSFLQGYFTGGAFRTLSQVVPYCIATEAYAITAAHGLGDAFSLIPASSSCLPGAPQSVTATADDASATVSFSPPGSDGGASITSYAVTSSPGGITSTGTSSPITVPGLTNGTTYAFTVVATNSVGVGPPSQPSNEATPGAALTAPIHMTATATGTTQVAISWAAAASADHYDVLRSSLGSAFEVVATPSSASCLDSGLQPGTTYLYKVRSVDTGSNVSELTPIDPATTIVFTDDPLQAGTTFKVGHMSELRSAVNAMRRAAGRDPLSFTDEVLEGISVRAVHLTELRSALNEAISTLGLATVSYVDPDVTAGVTPIRAIHLQQLRDAVK